MSDINKLQRYQELEAGRIIGELDVAEIEELEQLTKIHGCADDLSLELTFAAIETDFLESQDAVVPESLLVALNEGKALFANSEPSETDVIRPAAWQRVLGAPQIAWAVAALFAILLIANSFLPNSKIKTTIDRPIAVTPPTAEEARDKLVDKANDLVELDFGGVKKYKGMKGKVVWSDELQEGYMTFTGLATNDPKTNQYQLWIVDPQRDKKPVDGGVFDIPAGGDTVVIPIRNPLAVTNPQAFLITLEQPGGVVVSEKEVVVASAAKS